MKRYLIILSAAFLLMTAFVPAKHFTSSIHGMIDPPDGAKRVWAISGSDSVSVVPVTGNFTLQVKPGSYQIVVEAASPYKNTMVDNVQVQDGQSADAGVIKLQK